MDAVAIHGGGGLLGVLAAPIFMEDGLVYTGSQEALMSLAWNGIGAAAIIGWNLVCGVAMFFTLKVRPAPATPLPCPVPDAAALDVAAVPRGRGGRAAGARHHQTQRASLP